VRCARRKSHRATIERCATKKINSVVLVFYKDVEVFGFLDLYLEWEYKIIRCAMY